MRNLRLITSLGLPVFKWASLVAALLSAVACVGPNKSLYPPRAGQPARTVYVVNHGLLHTGVAVLRSEIPRGVWPASHDYAGFRYLEVGWGEDDGYRKNLTTGTAFRALRGSTRTVLLCRGFDQFHDPKASVVAVDLSLGGFARLCDHVAQTYALDASDQPILLEENWYRARGRYSAFHNCNNWIAAGLRKAGCPINPTVSITPRPLLLQVRQFGRDLPRAKQAAHREARQFCRHLSARVSDASAKVNVARRGFVAADARAETPDNSESLCGDALP